MTPDHSPSRITVEGPDQSGRPGRSHLWILPLVAIVVVGAIWSFRGEATPQGDPADLASFEVVTTTTEPPLAGDLSTGWVAIDLPGSGAVVEVVDTRFGLLAVGQNEEGTMIWRSTDGLSWQLLFDPQSVFESAEVNSVIESESGLVAVGAWIDVSLEDRSEWGLVSERRHPAVWLSADGETWDRLPDEQIARSNSNAARLEDDRLLGSMNDVLLFEDRLVAVGWSSSGNHQGAAWVSGLDGLHWRPATTGLDGGGTQFTEVEAVCVLEDELVAAGSTLSRPTLWTSPDAMTWASSDPAVTLGTYRNDHPAAMANRGSGLVSVGGHRQMHPAGRPPSFDTGYAVVWVSRDGREWVRLVPEELDGVALEDLIVADPWMIAAGNVTSEGAFLSDPAVWFSSTGGEWQKIDLRLEGYEWGEFSVNALVRGGPGLIAGGSVQGLPELWVWSPSGAIALDQIASTRPGPGRWELKTEFDPEFPASSVRVVFDEYLGFGDGLVWRSDDWLIWESEAFSEVGLAPGSWYREPVVIEEVAYTIDDAGRLWSSTDGHRWVTLGERNFPGWIPDGWIEWIEGPYPGPAGDLILVEHPEYEAQKAHLWRSSNGEQWSEIPLPELEWISDVDFIGDRVLLMAWSYEGPTLWVSTDTGDWETADLGGLDNITGELAKIDGRIYLTATQRFEEPPITSLLSSDDGLQWEITGVEFPGWARPIVPTGGGVAVLVDQGYGLPQQTIWVSADGLSWTRLGPVPSYLDSWAEVAPSRDAVVRVRLSRESHSSLWEWVPPDEG